MDKRKLGSVLQELKILTFSILQAENYFLFNLHFLSFISTQKTFLLYID
jgi:hypothetical protein